MSMLEKSKPTRLSQIGIGAPLTRKAELRRIAVRKYAGLRFHARNCCDCVPGATDDDPPRINRVCRLGMAGKADYEQAYQGWLNCPEEA